MSLFIFFQFIQLLLIICLKLEFISNIQLLNILTLTPIICSALYVTYYHKEINEDSKILYFSILSAILGDLFLIYYNQAIGISFFFLAQCFYYSYLNHERDNKALIIFTTFNFAACLRFGEIMLKPEAFFYAVITLFNILKSLELISKKKIPVEYFAAFIFLMLCDICLFLIFMIDEYNLTFINSNIFFIIEWICYISFQILLSTSLTNHMDFSFNEFLKNIISPFQVEEEKCKKV